MCVSDVGRNGRRAFSHLIARDVPEGFSPTIPARGRRTSNGCAAFARFRIVHASLAASFAPSFLGPNHAFPRDRHVQCNGEGRGPRVPAGLTENEAQRRLRETGPNALPAAERPSIFRRVGRQFKSALIYLLLLALAFDLAAWIHEGARGTPVEALAILAVLLLNAGLGVLQEYRSERALDELEKLSSPHVWVFRDGSLEQRNATELVPGDLVRVEAGDRVPADGIAVRPESLGADESLLTGESLAVEKSDGDALLSGTLIVRGHTKLEVTSTGPRSAMGRLAGTLSQGEPTRTLLERRIEELGRHVGITVGVLSLFIVVGGLAVEGYARFAEVVMFAVAFGVAVVPEGMPAVMTLVLSFGVQRMARANAVVRRLAAVEALGSVTIIASDKTGTLTLNKMVVDALHCSTEHEDEALLALSLANDADHLSEAGDPLEQGSSLSRGAGAPTSQRFGTRTRGSPPARSTRAGSSCARP